MKLWLLYFCRDCKQEFKVEGTKEDTSTCKYCSNGNITLVSITTEKKINNK